MSAMKFVTKGISGIPDGTDLVKQENGSLEATLTNTVSEGVVVTTSVNITETADNFKTFVDEVPVDSEDQQA